MGKITDDTLEQLKAIPIRDVADRLGLEAKARGNIRCFNKEAHSHGDRTPSLSLIDKTNTYYCHTCRINGDNIRLVMAVNGWDFTQAVEWIAQSFNIAIDRLGKSTNTATKQAVDYKNYRGYQSYELEPIRLDENGHYTALPFTDIYTEFYRNTENPDQQLLDWWTNRGFTIDDLKYYGWRRITARTYAETLKTYNEADLTTAGLVEPKNGYNWHFLQGHIAVPYFDYVADTATTPPRVLYLRARTLDPNARAKYIALKNTQPIIWGYRDLEACRLARTPERLYISESETDAIAIKHLDSQGIPCHAIALSGGGVGKDSLRVRELIDMLNRDPYRQIWGKSKADQPITILEDKDDTGHHFTEIIADQLHSNGYTNIEIFIADDGYKDASDQLAKTERSNGVNDGKI